MRDLVVHGDDIVVGTHGRSFWILDDITPLRQLSAMDNAARAGAHLFQPQVAYRVRRSTNTDTPLPPEEPAGQNPPDGAIINYYLKDGSQQAVLEVFDAAGKLVRRYASTDQPEEINPRELNVPTYWVKPSRVLAASAGMHRWVWNLHYPPPAVLKRDLPISAIPHDTPLAPQGPRALPGEYTVKLTAGGKILSQKLTVKMDPRVTTPAEGLAQQFDIAARIAEALQQDYDALQQVRSVRVKLRNLLMPANALPSDAAEAINELDKTLRALEGAPGEYGQRATSDNLAGLNSSLRTVYERVDSADTAPTSQVVAAFRDLQRSLPPLLTKWDEVKARDLPALNQKLRSANLPEVQISSGAK
jgi:hypothetical protein